MRFLALILAAFLAGAASAEVKLASLFQSNMVFQQKMDAPIWGSAKPGEKVTIRTSWGANASVVAKEDGRWDTKLKTPSAGGPFEVSISGDNISASEKGAAPARALLTEASTMIRNSLWLRNVMVGEVWVCSGQSNMEWPLGLHPGMTPVVNAADEVAAANYPNIRLFEVTKKMSDTVQAECGGKWQACTPATIPNFSATAYFFGRELHKQMNVPIGLIMTAWGGTEVELWTSEAAMKRVPELAEAMDKNMTARAEYRAAFSARESKLTNDPLRGFEKEDASDADWTRMPEPAAYEGLGLSEMDGTVWFRAKLLLTEAQAKGAAILNLGPIDDEDEVWINGARVGGNDLHSTERAYPVVAGVLKEGFNTVAIRTVDTGGLGGFQNPKAINLTVGEAKIPLTNWRYKIGVDLRQLPLPVNGGKAAASLYNGMIAPLIPFAIRGAIWYQGESNVSRAFQYRTSFPNMIKNWREDWGQGDFPFYFVQIAPFAYNAQDMSAELREAQTLTAQNVPHAGQAITMDLVPNLRDIHPPMKQEVGDRLARLALNLTYGKRDIVCFGPTYQSVKFDGGKARVKLSSAAGLMIKGEKLAGIEICGEDKVFVPAQATIEGETLVVWAEGVAKPVAVRFGWRDAVVTNLFNGAGLPAGPFRSDDWPGLTTGVKW